VPIITQCPSCGKKLRAPDQQEGKQAKCPQCKKPFVIKAVAVAAVAGAGGGSSVAGQSSVTDASSLVGGGAASGTQVRQPLQPNARPQSQPHPQQRPQPHPQQHPQQQPQPQPQQPQYPDQWYVQTGEGAEYGPVTFAELQQWVVEDRIDAECQILQDGWDQWKWAEDVFAELGGGGAVADNPFAAIAETPAIGGGSGPFAALGAAGDANPYAAPQVTSGPITTTAASDEGAITPGIVRAMEGTRPWVMFFAILAFIACGLLVIGTIFAVLFMLGNVAGGIVLFLIYAANAGIYGYIGYLLLTYAKSAGGFVRTGRVAELEKALHAQKDFWKTTGILTIVAISMSLIGTLSLFFLIGSIASNLPPSAAG
jgi:hypothetical protein